MWPIPMPALPCTFVRGEGCHLYDEAGKDYIDMGSGIAVSALGYGDEGWVAAVSAQAGQLAARQQPVLYRAAGAPGAAPVRAHGHETRVFWQLRRGGQRMRHQGRASVTAPYKHGEDVRPVILTLENSFHGRTLATLAATGSGCVSPCTSAPSRKASAISRPTTWQRCKPHWTWATYAP